MCSWRMYENAKSNCILDDSRRPRGTVRDCSRHAAAFGRRRYDRYRDRVQRRSVRRRERHGQLAALEVLPARSGRQMMNLVHRYCPNCDEQTDQICADNGWCECTSCGVENQAVDHEAWQHMLMHQIEQPLILEKEQ